MMRAKQAGFLQKWCRYESSGDLSRGCWGCITCVSLKENGALWLG